MVRSWDVIVVVSEPGFGVTMSYRVAAPRIGVIRCDFDYDLRNINT